MNILIIDNYDSFTYNLFRLVKTISGRQPDVIRSDAIAMDAVARYDKILLSPGPGIPSEAGLLTTLIETYAPTKSILGVCLGHQAIGSVFGAELHNLSEVYHGVATMVYQEAEDVLFAGMDTAFAAGRYHSWVVARTGFPECLAITATDEHGYIMALRHRTYDVKGIQFHPESILTPQGAQLMSGWLNS